MAKRFSLRIVVLALLISTSFYYGMSLGVSYAQVKPRIHVYVTDIDGFPLDGVLIQVISSVVVDSGTTVRGNWTSKPLDGELDYLVIASATDETAAESVHLGVNDVFVSFKLKRFIDKPRLVLTNVTFTSPKIIAGGIYEAILGIQNLGGNATEASLIVNMSYPFAIMTSGSKLDFGMIPTKANATAKLIFAVDSNARPGAYSIPYILRFTDAAKNEFSTVGKLGIVVSGVPAVNIGRISFEPQTIVPGTSGTLTITLTNTGTDRALNITVELSGLEAIFSTTHGRLGAVNPNESQDVKFGFKIPPDFTPGNYTINLRVTYADISGNAYKSEQPFVLRIFSRGTPAVRIGSIRIDPLTLMPGDSGTLTITLTNIGTDRALDVILQLSGLEEVFSTSYVRLGSIDTWASQDVNFGLKIPTEFRPGNYTVNLSVSHTDILGKTYKFEQPFLLRVFSRGAPAVRIGSIKLDPLTLMPGDSGTLIITLTNTGTDRALDVYVVLGGMTEVFSSTATRIGKIDSGGTESVRFGMKLPIDLDANTYTFDISVSYLDIFGKKYELKEIHQFTVFSRGNPLVKIIGIEQKPLTILPASDGEITITLSNIGWTRAYDVNVTFSGFIPGLSNTFKYLGSMQVNESATIKFGLKLEEKVAPGLYSSNIILLYKDAKGNYYSETQPFSLTVFPLAKPDVKIRKVSIDPLMLRPSSSATLWISLENVGTGDAKNIILKISGWDEGLSSTIGYVAGLKPGESSTLSFGVDVPLTMKASLVSLKAGWSYESRDGARFSDESPYELRIFPLGTPEVKIQKISSDPRRLTQGVNGSLTILLTNAGDGQARDVKVDVTRGPEVLSSTSGYVGILDVGQNTNVTFTIRIPRNMTAADYELEISISYEDASGKIYSEIRSFALSIFVAGRPEIKIQNVLYNPVKLAQGVSGFATIFLANTGDAQAKSITLKISGGGEVLANAILTVGAIDQGKTETVIIGVSIPLTTQPGTYLLKVSMVYEDFFGRTYEEAGFLEVSVYPYETLFTPTNIAAAGAIVAVASVGFLAWRRLR